MGCILGPNNQIMLDRARFFFDASQPWANQSATVFLNPFFNTSLVLGPLICITARECEISVIAKFLLSHF